MHGGPFSRQLIGVILICIGIGGIFGFEEWWPALLFIAIGWAILTFSLWRWQTPKKPNKYGSSSAYSAKYLGHDNIAEAGNGEYINHFSSCRLEV
jgi:hypothetical protein